MGHDHNRSYSELLTTNRHESRESWLRAATSSVRPLFAEIGYNLPDRIRYAIAFTSHGKHGKAFGECWTSDASADDHFEIIIRADFSDPLKIISILTTQLIHTLLPPEAKLGKPYRDIARRLGLEGSMRNPAPSIELRKRLNDIANLLGPIPHAKLDTAFGAVGRPKKQKARLLKAMCPIDHCGYNVRLAGKWLHQMGPPGCPEHGAMVCESRLAGQRATIACDTVMSDFGACQSVVSTLSPAKRHPASAASARSE